MRIVNWITTTFYVGHQDVLYKRLRCGLLSSIAACGPFLQICEDECYIALLPLHSADPQETTHGLNSIDPWCQNLQSWNIFLNLSVERNGSRVTALLQCYTQTLNATQPDRAVIIKLLKYYLHCLLATGTNRFPFLLIYYYSSYFSSTIVVTKPCSVWVLKGIYLS